jgi:hypothetical protein
MDASTLLTRGAAGTLAAIAGLHVAWGLGSSFPLRGREELFETVAGGADDAPGPLACFAVAGCLATSATAIAGRPRALPRLRRGAAAGTSAALGARALLGFAGRTELVAPGGRVSERFRRQDRRVYSPLCLAIAVAGAPAWLRSPA